MTTRSVKLRDDIKKQSMGMGFLSSIVSNQAEDEDADPVARSRRQPSTSA